MSFEQVHPPLSLRDISPTRGEIGRSPEASHTLISPLVGEMSARPTEGGNAAPGNNRPEANP